MTHFNNHGPVSNQTGIQHIYGDAYFGSYPPPPPVTTPNYNFGVRLGHAPQIDEDNFVGRERELEQLQIWLTPQPGRQNVVSLSGLGGIGKTQLSIHMIKRLGSRYSSVFWLNAKDTNTLKAGLAALAVEVSSKTSASPPVADVHEEQRLVQQARQWLSEQGNDKWLIVYDNYDDPQLPGIESSTGYDIRTYFPHRMQGSILITTRSPQLSFAKQFRLKKLEDIEQSLAILATGSGRNVDGDPFAMRLARRLDGLPLALATAGAYLSQSVDGFDAYLELYNHSWSDLGHYSNGPVDYERTLHSTWNVSYKQLRDKDPAAAELLKLMAYLDNQDLWFELFQVSDRDAPAKRLNVLKRLMRFKLRGARDVPPWWIEVLKSRMRFNRAVSTLHSYSLLEISEGRYSLHTCVHDWTLEYLNHEVDQERCQLAIHCVATTISWDTEPDYWLRNQRVLPHARRFRLVQINTAIDWDKVEPNDLFWIAGLYKQNDMNVEAEEMYLRALRGYEKTLGHEHTSTLVTVNNLGLLYRDQDRRVEAEEMYIRALQGYEKALGPEHTLTLNTVNDLGLLYIDQDKRVEGEEMYLRALRGYEKACGPEHMLTLTTVTNLGRLYGDQNRMIEAEEMLLRALHGKEKIWGSEHTSTLSTITSLGILYADQGRMVEAEEMYIRALQGYEKACGPEHTLTLTIVTNIGRLYVDLDRKVEAEEMLLRALQGEEKTWGSEHTSTLNTVNSLGILYAVQDRIVEAEEMLLRALQGYKKACGDEHTLTLETAGNLGVLYKNQGKVAKAEEMLLQALEGFKKAWGVEHTSTLQTVNNLGLLYADQGRMVEAKEMYVWALRGYQKVLETDHWKTQAIAQNLRNLQGEDEQE